MKKNFLVLIFAFFVLNFSFSYGGAMAGEKKLSVIKTEWFDIIHSENTEKAAKKIALQADLMYDELCRKLNVQKKVRFPVAITGKVENMNAFFSLAPYNLIVVYDTRPSPSLDMHEDTILSVFYHELTHAVTLNSKSAFWQGMSHFADFFTPAGISLTSFWFEGAAVSLEGREGEGGRLNDPFFTQFVLQSKINHIKGKKSFPSWRDVTGARDTFPGGHDAYAFGAVFAEFLQKKYGLEKYAEFWKNAGLWTTLSFVSGIFKKTYGTNLSDEWKNFFDSIEVPQSALLSAVPQKEDVISKKGALVKTFDVFFEKDFAKIVFFDSLSNAVFLSEIRSSGKKITKRLFSATGISRLVFSPDGKKIAVTRIAQKRTEKTAAGIFDIKKKSYTEIEKSGVDEAFFLPNGEISFLKIESNEDEIAFSPVSSKNASAKIVKKELSWQIRVEANEKTFFVDFGKKIVHNLHILKSVGNKMNLSFSWAQLGAKNSFSRFGFLSIDTLTGESEIRLQKSDDFAGILEAVPISFGADDFLLCAVEEVDENPLCLILLPETYSEKIIAEIYEKEVPYFVRPVNFNEKSYNPLFYYKNGGKFPVSICAASDFEFNQNEIAWLGGTFLSSNPWTDNQILFSGGWNPFEKFGGFSARIIGGDGVFSYETNGGVLFDGCGFLQTHDSISFSVVPHRFLYGAVSAGISEEIFFGEEKNADSLYLRRGLNSFSSAFVTLSRLKKSSPGQNQISGFVLKPFVYFTKKKYDIFENSAEIKSNIEKTLLNAAFFARICFSGIFPLDLSATLCGDEGLLLQSKASATLFSFEIQKGIPAISVFVNRVFLKASYFSEISCETKNEIFDCARLPELFKNVSKDDYSDKLSISLGIDFAPNTSYFAQSLSFSYLFSAFFRPNPKESQKKWGIAFSIQTNF